MIKQGKTMFKKDIMERILATYVCTFLGLLLGDQIFDISISHLQTVGVSALPATLSLVKGLIAKTYKGDDASLHKDV